MKTIPVTWDLFQRVHRKAPAGRRTWWFDIRVPGTKGPHVHYFVGNFPAAAQAAQVFTAKHYRRATEIVVLLL